ncbi:TolC family type I secretion outer membrane protein [Catenovulum agarivorans DS-2]|uniref:TolC family type I secretion outer membrane protein n=1 Tax=Catenovulum agarivorans DS-2 TaxID=1328313 RepID=W7QKA1_9ALTE|nr:TolC family outer membrane protein [Catenovulum agarivorans]EWH09377.1 TolC family type I secretion outer membrane protein [Catenovulum agarivorans DS-2]
MNNFIKSVVSTVFAGTCLSLPVTAKSLEEAVATAFNTNPELKAAYHRYKSAYHAHEGSQGAWLPSIDLRANIGQGKQNTPESRAGIEKEQIKPIEYNLSLQQILFDGFFSSNEIERNEQEMRSEFFALKETAENKALDTANAYIGVLREQQLYELAQRNLQSHQDIFEQIKVRADSGLGSNSELSQATGRLARAQANALAAENNLQDAIALYQTVVGEYPTDLIEPKVNIVKIPNTLADVLRISRSSHPTLFLANADISATQAQLKSSRSGYYPRVTLEVSKSRIDDRGSNSALRDELRADIVVSYNLFRGGRDKHNELNAAYQLEQAKDIREKALREVIEGAKLSWQAKESLEKQLGFLQIHVEQSYLTQQAYKKQFDLGRRTLLDLLDTENELFEARKSHVNAKSSHIVAQYRVLNAMGRLLNSLEINPQEYWQVNHD